MSWGIQRVGKVAAVKAALAKDFESVKAGLANIPLEQQTAAAIETAINASLDFLADVPGVAVKISAGGSVYKLGDPPTSGSAGANLSFETLFNFAE